jgi:uncharacterized RDD family membrane protein YckC
MATKTLETRSFELASIEARFTALFVDSLLLGIFGGFGFMAARVPVAGLSFLIGLLYTWFFLTRNNGQTLGKALLKIRVVKVDGSAISDSDAIIRYVVSFLNYFFLIGWLWALFDANQQGWHDKAANTYVVRVS